MCFYPRPAYLLDRPDFDGRRVVFKHPRVPVSEYDYIHLPCRQCLRCRLRLAQSWAIRIENEADCYDRNCFITLTFNEIGLMRHGPSLRHDFWQKFMMRLRKRHGAGIRSYMCGEYGEKFQRPHYHAVLFNFNFDDLVPFRSSYGSTLYTSEELKRLWTNPDDGYPYGFVTVGSVTYDSAAYVARYCLKKVNGIKAKEHYSYTDPYTGRVLDLKPEYNVPSKGLGRKYYEMYKDEIYVTDSIVNSKGRECRPPKYYDTKFQLDDPVSYARVKEQRILAAEKIRMEMTKERVAVLQHALELNCSRPEFARRFSKGVSNYEI